MARSLLVPSNSYCMKAYLKLKNQHIKDEELAILLGEKSFLLKKRNNNLRWFRYHSYNQIIIKDDISYLNKTPEANINQSQLKYEFESVLHDPIQMGCLDEIIWKKICKGIEAELSHIFVFHEHSSN